MLGTRVASALDDVEKQLHVELTQLDRFTSTQNTGAAYRRLMREQHGWDAADSGGGGGGGGEAAALAAGVQVLWDVLQLLPDFRRKTLQAQHVALFEHLIAAEAEKRRLEAASRKKEQAAAAAAAAAANRAAGDGGAEVEMLEADGQQGPDAAGPAAPHHQQQPQQQRTQPGGGSSQQDAQPPPAEAQGSDTLATVLEAVGAGQAFAGSSCWWGRVAGYCFKMGTSGLGYYRDAPPAVENNLTFARVGASAREVCMVAFTAVAPCTSLFLDAC